MNLFNGGNFVLHSGYKTNFKIDCDALTDEDWEAIALIVTKMFSFSFVKGIPNGGTKLAKALEKYSTFNAHTILIVDDVLTTGASMEEEKKKLVDYDGRIAGVVLFSRGACPNWVFPVFQFNSLFRFMENK